MNKILHIILISLFSFTIITCAKKSSTSSSSTSDDTNTTSSSTSSWTKQIGTSSKDSGKGVTIDSLGNIYITGVTEGGLDGNTSNGEGDIFLLKYDSNGNKQWTRQLGTSLYDVGRGMTVDSSNNVYVTGYTKGELDGYTNSGEFDLFLVKYDSNGTKQWTRQMGTTERDVGWEVSADTLGNVYLVGYSGKGMDGNTYLGDRDVILIKYNSSGTKIWSKQLGTSNDDVGWGVKVDLSNNIYVTGFTCGGIDNFTNSVPSDPTGSGCRDYFLMKLDSEGTNLWSDQIGTIYEDRGEDITVDSSNNVYVVGRTGGAFDGQTNYGENDTFLVKYDLSGTKQWTKQFGSSGDDWGLGISADSSDNIYITGNIGGPLDGELYNGKGDLFLMKFNSSGTKKWTRIHGTYDHELSYGETIDSSGNIYVTGETGGKLDENTNSGNADIFLVKYNSDGVKQ